MKKARQFAEPFHFFFFDCIILDELLQMDKHLHKYHTLCKHLDQLNTYHLQK